MKFQSLLDAACYLIRAGFQYEEDYQRFVRGSWHARIIVQKNGKCRTVAS